MPLFTRGDVVIHYEDHGTGYPLVLFAPGGMRSSIPIWDRAPFSPVRELHRDFRVVAMDQRNAGKSSAPITPADDWKTYTEDHVALLDHLGIERCHVMGGCIGASFCLSLIESAPGRVSAAVLQQPIGLQDNRHAFHEIFDDWVKALTQARPDITEEALAGLRKNFYDGDFVFSVSRSMVEHCPVPLLVLRGNDIYHPSETSEELVRLAPRAELVTSWKEGTDVGTAIARVRAFLQQNTPA